ncbi:hypothetical protein TRVL_08971 [Trypanosoma vivax]|nr:hypothetical protein TRVL_08971 [Trypanosoma vivax]
MWSCTSRCAPGVPCVQQRCYPLVFVLSAADVVRLFLCLLGAALCTRVATLSHVISVSLGALLRCGVPDSFILCLLAERCGCFSHVLELRCSVSTAVKRSLCGVVCEYGSGGNFHWDAFMKVTGKTARDFRSE